MCFSTARLVSTSDSAIAALLLPSAISRQHLALARRQLGERRPLVRARARMSGSTIFGSITEPPASTVWIAPTSWARSCTRSLSR